MNDAAPGTEQLLDAPPCPSCDGAGFTEVDHYDLRGEHYTRAIPCSECEGDGLADEDEAADYCAVEGVGGEVAW